MEFPENQAFAQSQDLFVDKIRGAKKKREALMKKMKDHTPSSPTSPQSVRQQKYGLKVTEFMAILEKHTGIEKQTQVKIQRALDHADPEIITWREFSAWFTKEGESRDKVHSAQLYQMGMTRIYENENKREFSLTTKRTEYKVRHITPIDGIPGLDLLFVVFENCVANIYDINRGMLLIHQLEYEREFDVDPQRYLDKQNGLLSGREHSAKKEQKLNQETNPASQNFDKSIKNNEQSFDHLLVGDSVFQNVDGTLGQNTPFEQIKEEPEDFEKDTKDSLNNESIFSKTIQATDLKLKTENERDFDKNIFKAQTKIVSSNQVSTENSISGLKERRRTVPARPGFGLQTIQEKSNRPLKPFALEQTEMKKQISGQTYTKTNPKATKDISQTQIFEKLEKCLNQKRQAVSVGRSKPASYNQSTHHQKSLNIEQNQTVRLQSKLRGQSANPRRKFSIPRQMTDGLEVLGLTDLRQFDNRIGGGKQIDKSKKEENIIPPPIVVPRPSRTGKTLVGDLLPEDMLRYGIPENLFVRKSEVTAAKDEHTQAIRKLNEKINANNGELAIRMNQIKNNQKQKQKKFHSKKSPSNLSVSSKMGFLSGQDNNQDSNYNDNQNEFQPQKSVISQANNLKNPGTLSKMNQQSQSRASLSSDKSRQSKSRPGSISSYNFKLTSKGPSDKFADGARLIDRKQRERKVKATKMFDQIKPNIDQLIAQQHTRRKIESHQMGVQEMPFFNYNTKSVEVTCTTQSLNTRLQKLRKQEDPSEQKVSDLFKSPNDAEIKKKVVNAKVDRLEHDMKILQDLFDDKYIKMKQEEAYGAKKTASTTANFSSNQDQQPAVKLNKKTQKEKDKVANNREKQEVIKIKAAPKDMKIKPGGGVDSDEDTTIPRVASCHWYGPFRLLIICLVNQELMLYKIRGMVKKNLDIDRFQVSYKNPFSIEFSKIGIHKITKELILVMVGQRQVLAIGIDPKSKYFLKPINDSGKPKYLPQPSKKYYTLSGKASVSKDLMTSMNYDETLGIVITYFNGNFRMYDPFNFQREIWFHPEMSLSGDEPRDDNITFVTSALTKKLGILAIGGREGRVFVYDLSAQFKIGMNDKVHEAEILRIFFHDDENQMISISKDRQISLWDANKFEPLQTIKDTATKPGFFAMAFFDERQRRLFTAAYRLAIFRLNLNEKVELEAVQTRALADQSKEQMCELLLNESKEHRDTFEGKIVYSQLLVEQRGYKKQINNFMDKVLAAQLAQKLEANEEKKKTGLEDLNISKIPTDAKNYRKLKSKVPFASFKKKARDFGRAIISQNCQLVAVELLQGQNRFHDPDAQRIYTVDSDFMIRTWDLSDDGQCKESTILNQCTKYLDLMCAADRFRLDMGAYSSSDHDHGLKRKLDCVDITAINGKYPQLVAISDDTGIIQINNFQTGNILLSLANRRNKAELTKIHFLQSSNSSGKMCMVATCTDGRVMFFTRPNIRLDKESQPSDVSHTLIKQGTHEGELYAICSDDQWVAVGGRDNKISFWKASSGTLSTTVSLPNQRNDLSQQKQAISQKKSNIDRNMNISQAKKTNVQQQKPNLINISDMKFLNSTGSGRSKASYLLVLQNNGAGHIAHPTSNTLIKAFIFQSGCSNGILGISQDGRNSIFICNDTGKVAETYRFYKNDFDRSKYVEYQDDIIDASDLQSDSSCISEKIEKLKNRANEGPAEEDFLSQESLGGIETTSKSKESSINVDQFENPDQINTETSLERRTKIGRWLDAVLDQKKLRIMKQAQSTHTKERYLQYKQNKGGSFDKRDEFNAIFEKVASWNPFDPQLQATKEGLGIQYTDQNDSKNHPEQDNQFLVSAKILGGGLCVSGLSNGVVRLFDFLTGNLVYTLNTSQIYEYPKHKVLKCIKLDITKIKAKDQL